MDSLRKIIKSVTIPQILAVVLIVLGLGVMVSRGLGMFNFYKEVRFARENNFKAGNISPDLLRPWMSIRYISVAYAVPQKYLFDAAGIQPKEENSMIALIRLNRNMHLGTVNGNLALMNTIKDAIIKYRLHPEATGLIERQVRDWMSVQYVANSIGVPAETIFKDLNIPMAGNAYVPLGYLSKRVNYPGGPAALSMAVQKIVDSQPVTP